jgi:hypothetical protein
MDLAPLVNKTVDFAYRGARLSFDLSHALFSSFAIDTGTRFLLKEIAHDETITEARLLLDTGCGAGIIGISMAASCPDTTVVMQDRDLLACAFTERNCWKNGLPNRRFGLGGEERAPIGKVPANKKASASRPGAIFIEPGLLGQGDSRAPYDAILSNLPAKAGTTILSKFIQLCGSSLLAPGGKLAFVIVNTLAVLADGWCESSGLALEKRVAGKGHTVFILRKPEISAAGRDQSLPSFDIYHRTKSNRALGRYSTIVNGYWGLPEFDTNGFDSELAIVGLEKACAGSLMRNILVFEPGIGLAARWACRAFGAGTVHVLSRDMLSIAATRENIAVDKGKAPGFEALDWLDSDLIPPASMDAVIWFPVEIPEYDFISPAWNTMLSATKKGGGVIIVASSGTIARFEKTKPAGMRKLGEKKKKGFTLFMAVRE